MSNLVSCVVNGCRSRDRVRRGEVSSEVMSLETSEIAYLLGRNGSTKQRLANFSGARLEIDPRDDGGRIEVIGTQEERELARLCVDITLQQRNNGRVQVDIDKLEARHDVSFVDVPKDAVGFVLVPPRPHTSLPPQWHRRAVRSCGCDP
jgi:hypothetical protein